MNYIYNNAIKHGGPTPNHATKAVLEDIAATKERVELELQRSMIIIHEEGLSVKMTPDLSEFL
jgi:hypothetical protein